MKNINFIKELSILEPNEKSPIRQYMPKVIDQSDVFSKSKDFKPGFLPQAEEFLEIVRGENLFIQLI